MPSPIGHALGGLAAGWLAGGIPSERTDPRTVAWMRRPGVRRAALFILLGLAPDLDLLVGPHRTCTHSISAALIAGLIAFALTRTPALACAAAAAWGSHVLLDWLGDDTSAPIGIMALWPFSTSYYQSPVSIFMAISRRYWRPDFIAHNSRAIARELLILVPLVWLAWFARRKERSGSR